MMASTKVQELREQGSVHKVLRPVIYLSKATGLAPYRLISYNGIDTSDIKLSIPAVIYSGLLATFIVYGCADYTIGKLRYLSKMKISRVAAFAVVDNLLSSLATVVSIINIIFKYKYIKEVLTTIEAVDNILLKIVVTYSKKMFNLSYVKTFILILGFVAFALTKCYIYIHRDVSYAIIFAHMINIVIKITFISQRSIIIKIIESKFKILNDILEKMFDNMVITRIIDNEEKHINNEGNNNMGIRQELNNVVQESSGESKTSVRGSDIQIRAMALCHHRLTDVTLTINVMYGFANLIDVFTTFVHITSYLCYGIYIVSEMREEKFFGLKFYGTLVLSAGWATLNIAKALLTIQFCSDARAESLDTVRIANELLLTKDLSADDKDQLRMLVSQVRSREVTFTATGFITLDYSFLSSMLGAIATYVLVILQLDPVQ